MRKNTSKSKKQPEIDTKVAVQTLQYLLAAGYVSRKRLYLENFVRGIFFSLGTIVGATIVIGLLLWILSVFDTAPFIGNYIETVQESLKSAQ